MIGVLIGIFASAAAVMLCIATSSLGHIEDI
jgi:hypothetical protein